MDYRPIIESQYNRENWQHLLHDIFGQKIKFWNTPSRVNTSSPFARQARWLGKIILSDEQTISVYEVELSDSVDIERNRRGIRDMLLTDWRNNGNAGAFMFCYRKDESVLRFSYVSESWTFAEDGSYQKESTDTRRFTYLLGEGHRSRTAIQQFEKLRDSNLSLKDLTKAFSVDAVSDMFFKGYKEQYEDIIQYVTGKRMVKVSNKWEEKVVGDPCENIMQEFAHFTDPEKSIRDYVKKLMGRIVFLQFLQKKGWLGVPADGWWGDGDPEFLQTLFAQCSDKEHFVDNVLEPLFNDLNTEREGDISHLMLCDCQFRVPYLNGGLFEREATDRTAFPLPAKYMQSMLDFFSSYNFTIDENDPDDAEVGVDPEMLGRIFENLLEDNKDKGAFYTPKEIVSYMCRESLIAYLQTDIEDEATKNAIRQFVTTHEKNGLLPEDTDQKLRDVKICDPAIGSGAFPMGLLKELFLCRTALEGIDQSKAAEIKKHIIQQNIYGVDIERGAVDIARLRFWLALIVDEDTPHALPNLDFKIMQGNSLLTTFMGEYINLDTKMQNHYKVVEMKEEKRKLYQLKKEFYDATGERKLELTINIKDTILRLISMQLGHEFRVWVSKNVEQLQMFEQSRQLSFNDIQQILPEEKQHIVNQCKQLHRRLNDNSISLIERAQTNIHFFDWRIMFTEVFDNNDSGFDIVIGNPPYFNVETLGAKSKYIDSIKTIYSDIWQDKSDILFYFFRQAMNLSKRTICFITSNAYLFSDKASKLRNAMIHDGRMNQIVNFEEFMIFNSASITTCITLFNSRQTTVFAVNVKGKDHSLQNVMEYIQNKHNIFAVKMRENAVFALVENDIDTLNLKIDGSHKSLRELFAVGSGMQTAANNIFCFSEYPSQFPPKYIKRRMCGETINRYYISPKEEYILYIEDVDKFENLPGVIQDYLNENRHILSNRAQIKRSKTSLWWKYTFAMHKENYHLNKIWCSYRAKTNKFVLDETSEYIGLTNTTVIFDTNDVLPLKYLLALLNSKVLTFRYKSIGKQTGGGVYEYFENGVGKLPIPLISKKQQQPIVSLVDQIISAKNTNPTTDTSDMESKIDRFVYHLYNLNYYEVLVIDPNPPFTREEYENENK